jgi:hypothetical protein
MARHEIDPKEAHRSYNDQIHEDHADEEHLAHLLVLGINAARKRQLEMEIKTRFKMHPEIQIRSCKHFSKQEKGRRRQQISGYMKMDSSENTALSIVDAFNDMLSEDHY